MTAQGTQVAASELPPVTPEQPVQAGVLERVAAGTAWKLIGTLAARAFTVVAMIYAARLLGKADFGALGMVQSTVGMFGVLAGLGLGVTATKYIAELRDKDTDRLGRILSLVLAAQTAAVIVTSIVIVAVAGMLASRAINAPHLAGELRMAAALLCLLALSRLATDALAGFEAWRAVALVSLVQGAVMLPGVLVLTRTHGVAGAVAALALAAGAGALVGGTVLVRRCRLAGVRLHSQGMWSEAGVLWRFALPATLTALTVGPVLWAANAILVNAPGGYGELGAFAATLQWKNLLMYLPGAMGAAFLPVLAHIHGRGDRRGFQDAVTMQVNLLSLSIIPLAVLVVCASRYILMLYGRDFAGYELLLTAVLLGGVIHALTGALMNVLVSAGRMWFRMGVYAVGGACLVGGAAVMASTLGALGLAVAHLAAYSCGSVVLLIALKSRAVAGASALLVVQAIVALSAAYALCSISPLIAACTAPALAVAAVALGWWTCPSDWRKRSLQAVRKAGWAPGSVGRLLRREVPK